MALVICATRMYRDLLDFDDMKPGDTFTMCASTRATPPATR